MTGPSSGLWADGPDPARASGRAASPVLPPELNPRGRNPRPPGTPPPAPPRRRWGRILAWVAGGLAVVLLIGGVTGWAALDHFLANIKKIDVFSGLTGRPSGGVVGDMNILVVGSDSRAGLSAAQQRALHVGNDPGQRSDTMILLHIPRGGGKAVLISLPRDSYVVIPAHRDASGHLVPAQHNKLNAAYSEGGAKLTVATVEHNTHVRIDHYVEINFLGFVKMVNALGGVTVCTPSAINDPVVYDPTTGRHKGSGLHLPAGKSHVNGTVALEYVRAREFDPSADIGRIQRQQRFMSALMQRAESTGTLLNPLRLLHFLDAVTGSLTTDKTFGAKQIRTLALKLRSMSPTHVELLTVPLRSGSYNTAVGNVVEWDPVFAPQLFTDITQDRPVGAADQGKSAKVTIPPGSIALDVRNATNINGLAARVAGNLSTLGFHVSSTGNARPGSDSHAVVVRYGPQRADSAKTVAAAIPGSKLQLDPSFGANLQVVVGSDYHGVQRVVVASPSTEHGIKVRTAAQDVCS